MHLLVAKEISFHVGMWRGLDWNNLAIIQIKTCKGKIHNPNKVSVENFNLQTHSEFLVLPRE